MAAQCGSRTRLAAARRSASSFRWLLTATCQPVGRRSSVTAARVVHMADSSTEDFLDAPEPATPAYTEETIAAGSSRRGGIATWMSTGAWLLAGLVIGALVVAMLHTNSSTTASNVPAGAPAANQAPTGQIPNGQLPGGV